MDLDVWACPVCHSRLEGTATGLRCSSEGRPFRTSAGLPVLIRPEEEGLLADAQALSDAWKQDRFAPPEGRASDLPYIAGSTWRQKARSLEALLSLLGPGNGRKVVDMGAGTGWLSFRLTENGFRCYATDLSADSRVGLGAADAYDRTPYAFQRALALLTRWPVQDGSIDVAICNASLHYLEDIRPAVAEAARVLAPAGRFILMNDPVHRESRSAHRAGRDFQERMRHLGGHGALVDGHRHFVASELEDTLRVQFPRVERHDPDLGRTFRTIRALKGMALRMELASFPIYVARR